MLTSDFLATGDDRLFTALGERGPAVRIEDDPPLREALAEQLAALGAVELAPTDWYDPTRPRVRIDGVVPLRCDAP